MNSTLDKIIQLNREHPELHNEKGYSIFSVLQIQDKELLICRMIADLLNPRGMHGAGSDFLKLFIDEVLKIKKFDKYFVDSAKVTAEYVTDSKRRIDLVIEIGERFIPIEVKIYAGDQNSQCHDYYYYAKGKDSETKVYYLTTTGHAPSEGSLSGLNGMLDMDDVVCISFKEHILGWLRDCIDIAKDDMRIIISQFIVSIETVCGYTNEKVINMISDVLFESEEALRAGIQISDSINVAKVKLMREVFVELEKQMEPIAQKYNYSREKEIGWYEYETQAEVSFYNPRSHSTYPGINYVVNNVKMNDGYQLWFRIEVEHYLYAGFCVFDPNGQSEEGQGKEVLQFTDDTRKSVKDALNVSENDQAEWWATWWILPSGGKEENRKDPNFKTMNDVAISLADPEKRKKFVAECIMQIEACIQSVMKQ